MKKNSFIHKSGGIVILFIMGALLWSAATTAANYKAEYHNYSGTRTLLKDLAKKYKNLCSLTSIGKSLTGKEILVLQISNQKKGDLKAKPALFLAAGLDGTQNAGTEVCLFTAEYLLQNYSLDNKIKNLLDNGTIFILPMANPDACDKSVQQPGKAQSTNFRPYDDDRDGQIDEDRPEDLNGDGVISLMRLKTEAGMWRRSKLDSRILVPIRGGQKGEYEVFIEGLDSDGDGRFNEDGIGGVDLNKNFPTEWKMNHVNPGSGMYPGSEPESEAILQFFADHPNIYMALLFESGKGALYRPFYALPDKQIPDVDMKCYKMFRNIYEDLTGLPMTHGYREAGQDRVGKADAIRALRAELEQELPAQVNLDEILNMRNLKQQINTPEARQFIQQYNISEATIQKIIRLQELVTGQKRETTTRPTRNKTGPGGYGRLVDWIYKDYNAFALAVNVWTLPKSFQKVPEPGIRPEEQEDANWLRFFDQQAGGKGFVPWKPFTHPQLGEVEIGGFIPFYRNNPPVGPELMKICRNNAQFVTALGEFMPKISIQKVTVKPLQVMEGTGNAEARVLKDGSIEIRRSGKTSGKLTLAEIEVFVENTGLLATRNALAQRTRYAQQPPRSVLVELQPGDKNLTILTMPRVLRLGAIEGTQTARWVNRKRNSGDQQEPTLPPTVKSGKWLVKIKGNRTNFLIRAFSEKAGTATKKVTVEF